MNKTKDYFPVLKLSRDDFKAVGYDASGLDDIAMAYIANKLGDCLMSGGDYWIFLEIWGENNGLPKIEKPE